MVLIIGPCSADKEESVIDYVTRLVPLQEQVADKMLIVPRILKEVLHSCRYNPDLKRLVKGFMVESYIEDGNQPVDGGVYGKSIADACLGWEKSERLILDMAELLT